MKRKPHVQDYNRKINIVFYGFMEETFEKYKPYFPKDFYNIKQENCLDEISFTLYNEIPDLVVFPNNFQILSRRIEKVSLYVERQIVHSQYKEISKQIRSRAYENYILRVKNQIADIVKKHEDDIQNASKEIIDLFDLKGPYFKDHAIRVSYYSVFVGKKLNLCDEELLNLKYASLLHDIGLLTLPSSIIYKPGDFSNYEKILYKFHTLIGEYLIGFAMFRSIKKLIRYHHERMDGKGFLKKKEVDIPLCSKIIAICDTFDLMTTSNLLTSRKSYEEALLDLERMSQKKRNSQKGCFEQEICTLFIEIIKKNKGVFSDMNAMMEKL